MYGTKGSFVHDLQGGAYYRSRDPGTPPEVTQGAYEHDANGDVLRSFIARILNGTPGLVSAGDVLDAMAVSLAVERSLRTGRWEQVQYAYLPQSMDARVVTEFR